ncbi:MAG: hypothetical protein KGY99_11330 [Phycisphaerae bacterium]|nr:hypothetical protein [Phycisphaerae bacterium]
MARYCQRRSVESRKCRKRALLAAARHGTVTLPALAAPRKRGRAHRYRAGDLRAAWDGHIACGIDLPELLTEHCEAHA